MIFIFMFLMEDLNWVLTVLFVMTWTFKYFIIFPNNLVRKDISSKFFKNIMYKNTQFIFTH